jgi:hypothetical protein
MKTITHIVPRRGQLKTTSTKTLISPYIYKIGVPKPRTLEMAEQVVADIARSLGATVAVVDANEGAEGPGLDLALVLEDLVGLDHGHGEISGGRPSDIAKPQQSMFAFSSTGTVAAIGAEHADGIEFLTAEWLQAEREQIHQCLEHPTSLINPNPNSSQREHWNLFRRLRKWVSIF